MKTAIGLMLVLAVVGCGDDPSNGTPEVDAGAGGVLAGDTGPGGSGGTATGGTGGSAPADGGGTGGIVTPGTGGAGSGGAAGSGGVQGSGGVVGTGGTIGSGGSMGTGGAPAGLSACAIPVGWSVNYGSQCMKANGSGGFTGLKKSGTLCTTNCQSVRPNGTAGSYLGPPSQAECSIAGGDYVCVASCGECS